MIPAFEINHINKVYPNSDEPALNNISLTLPQGQVLGLLGPNGAGKTTLISIISGLLKPDSGTVNLFGENPSKVKSKLGLVPQEIALYPTLNAKENLYFFGKLYGIKTNDLKGKITYWLSVLGLDLHSEKLVGNYSGGMKRRLNLIAALLHDPQLLILDEPTVGIDIHSKNIILEQLAGLQKEGMTVLYTSHQMEEAEKICTKIAIVDKGRLIWEGGPDKIANKEVNVKLEEFFLELTGKDLRD